MPFGFGFLHRLLGDVHTPHYFNEVALVGAAADKPTGADAKDNMLYYETDTGLWKRYRTALTSWVIVTSIAQVMGYDYTAALLKNVALDPETKALKIKSQITGAPPETYVLKAGDTMTGLLILSGNPVQALGAVTKQYADKHLLKSGGTMTGLLTLSGAPTSDLHASTKKYVDDQSPVAFNNYKCRAYLGSNQVINRETYTKINLSAVSYDPYGCFDSGNKSIKIKKAGDYLICASIWYDYGCGAGSVHMLQVKKNSTIIMEKDDMCPGVFPKGKDVQPAGSDIWPFALNDQITLNTKYWGGDATAEIRATSMQNHLTLIRMR